MSLSAETDRPLALWHAAWCGPRPALQLDAAAAASPRAVFDEAGMQLPRTDPVSARAAIAHVAAHRTYGGERFPVGGLKPIQIALVSLLEDARVERLAMQARPGLRRLWAPWFAAAPDCAGTELLLWRLARALFDFECEDGNPWVEKGRALFRGGNLQWRDPGLSRAIGNLLGNDLGQMRVQFNWKSYSVQPAYRDDNSGLWQGEPAAPEPPPRLAPQPEDAEVRVQRSAGGAGDDSEADTAVLSLPEWDYRPNIYRRDWVTVRRRPAPHSSAASIAALLRQQRTQVARLADLLRAARAQRRRRRRLPDGDGLDLDACISARIDRRAGLPVDPRVYAAHLRTAQPLALSLLLDASQSTADALPGGTCVLDLARNAAALLAEAVSRAGDAAAITAFRSDGRGDVRLEMVKTFADAWDAAAQSRLAGVRSGLSTRLGAALRGAGAELLETDAQRRVLCVLSDGEPADIDVFDSRYLREDARRAVQELQRRGVETFCFGLGSTGAAGLQWIFGRGHAVTVERLERLAETLQRFYFRLG